MKPVLAFLLALSLPNIAHAQNAAPAAGTGTPRRTQTRVGQPRAAERTPAFVPIDPGNLKSLQDFTADPDVRAISLGVTRAQLKANVAAQAALLAWVRYGGVVFLHTDAAQLFGYETIAARESSPQLAGHLFGRARAAIPFGGHPLLWGVAGRVDEDGQPARNGALAGASAVRSVWFQAQSGDHFVVGHPRGVPLLEIVEPGGVSRQPLYAAAIAPYGRGWAIVTPNFVEPQRGDGSLFATNLLRFANVPLTPPNATGAAAKPPEDPYVMLPASLIEAAAEQARAEVFDGRAVASALVALAARVDAPATASAAAAANARAGTEAPEPKETEKKTPLAIRASERNALWRSLSRNDNGSRMQMMVLRARLALQSRDFSGAMQWIALAEETAPTAVTPKVWSGILRSDPAWDTRPDSPPRALRLQGAAAQWNAALAVSAPDNPAAAGSDAAAPEGFAEAASTPKTGTIGGVPRELVALWAREAANAARLAAAEPPYVTRAGNFYVRHYLGDSSLRLVLPTVARLDALSRVLGVSVDDEEVILFATPEELATYRAARGGVQALAGAEYGDVSGSKILMVSRPAAIIFLPPLTPGGARRPVQVGASLPLLISRLHAQVLINSLTADGTPVPAWLQVGIRALGADLVVGDNTVAIRTANGLRSLAAANRLLNPAQYEDLVSSGTTNETQTALAEAQASSIVRYFIAQKGSGALVELLQRLGAGESMPDAMNDTAGADELALFTAWAKTAFAV